MVLMNDERNDEVDFEAGGVCILSAGVVCSIIFSFSYTFLGSSDNVHLFHSSTPHSLCAYKWTV